MYSMSWGLFTLFRTHVDPIKKNLIAYIYPESLSDIELASSGPLCKGPI